jgi:deoxycytidine triphosphate deaminase
LEVKEDPERKGRALEDVDDEDKIYKPSGPDGRGWGEYRQYTEAEQKAIKEDKLREEQKAEHVDDLFDTLMQKREQVIIDEDERVKYIILLTFSGKEN